MKAYLAVLQLSSSFGQLGEAIESLKSIKVQDFVDSITLDYVGANEMLKMFKDYEPGFVHVDVKDLPRMPDEAEPRDLFAAIDRASRWVDVEIQPDKTATTAAGFSERLRAKAPFRIRTVRTDHGKGFTDRLPKYRTKNTRN